MLEENTLMSDPERYAKNAKSKPVCRSCIMAEEQGQMDKFLELGVKKIARYKANGAFVVEVPVDKMDEFVELYTSIMQPGYWNEYLGPKTGFFFKTTDGKVKHYPVTSENTKKINETMRGEFISSWDLNTDLWDWLANVEIYSGWIKEK